MLTANSNANNKVTVKVMRGIWLNGKPVPVGAVVELDRPLAVDLAHHKPPRVTDNLEWTPPEAPAPAPSAEDLLEARIAGAVAQGVAAALAKAAQSEAANAKVPAK